MLTALGLGPQLGGWKLTDATGISADGQVIVGDGISPDGQTEAWMAIVPEPGTALLVALGSLGLAASRRSRAN